MLCSITVPSFPDARQAEVAKNVIECKNECPTLKCLALVFLRLTGQPLRGCCVGASLWISCGRDEALFKWSQCRIRHGSRFRGRGGQSIEVFSARYLIVPATTYTTGRCERSLRFVHVQFRLHAATSHFRIWPLGATLHGQCVGKVEAAGLKIYSRDLRPQMLQRALGFSDRPGQRAS